MPAGFLVDHDLGFQVAQKLIKMGFRGSQTAELVFDDMVVPMENIVGAEHEGHQVVMSGLDYERAIGTSISVGIIDEPCSCPSNTPRPASSSVGRSRSSRWCRP